jgi:hypothetical protein
MTGEFRRDGLLTRGLRLAWLGGAPVLCLGAFPLVEEALRAGMTKAGLSDAIVPRQIISGDSG